MLTPVIMAGGSGSRLWPLSRQSSPKQFLQLTSEHSLFQETLLRLDNINHSAPIIVTSNDHRFLVAEQLRKLDRQAHDIILEPVPRNTAPAVALAAHAAMQNSDPILLVLAADHHITDTDTFLKAVHKGISLAESGYLVAFGITPQRPETGYGYILQGEPLSDQGRRIKAFVEKPDLACATEYVAGGNHLWNSGIFMFRASQYLRELQTHQPDMASACKASMASASCDLDFIRADSAHFTACPDNSIDYAVMEKTDCAAVVEMDAGWSDVGSWESLWETLPHDPQGNVISGDALDLDSSNCYINAQHRLVATLGLQDLVVVETKDAVLIADRHRSQEVKSLVERINLAERPEASTHSHVSRPWGAFDTIDAGPRYQVKRITVNPGQRLSLQMHYHRAEHWIVVSGTARVICGEQEQILGENQSTYIPLGMRHMLENPGKVPLELIEVQSGNYLGEDDIVRFDDIYGRCTNSADK